jgi:hypothetical protein
LIVLIFLPNPSRDMLFEGIIQLNKDAIEVLAEMGIHAAVCVDAGGGRINLLQSNQNLICAVV